MHPLVALVTVGVETDVLGLSYRKYVDAARKVVIEAHPRGNFCGVIRGAARGVAHDCIDQADWDYFGAG
jgi:hypothetical protein